MASSTTSLLVWALVAAFISQNMVSCSTFQDKKNFFLPPLFPGGGSPPIDPGVGSPPTDPGVGYPPIDPGFGSPPVIQTPPVVPSPPIGYYTSPPPSHGSGGSTPPAHHTPSHGGHHHHGGNPPSNCGNPPPSNCGSPPPNCGNPTPKSPPKHVDPSPPHHSPSPAPPTGGYHYNPPSSGGSPPTDPSSPPVVLPPTTPESPPLLPSPPYDPNTPPIGGTCNFWRNHPGIIWGLFGWWGTTIGSAFGTPSALPATGAHLNLLQALSNTKTDGISALYREGTASLLNSMVNKNFPYTTNHVKDSFVAALGSNKAAAAQARVFKLANEGHMKLRV
ncbi:uncharacterized protein LOC143562169 isoform X1 [Bidens hawaiensis]|uniref:uncharacterized protein LOC143562169 isoform X1 n=1 Tax=Bidens hawaiensis TaxID=980011 RepID=UPI00404AC0ED